MADFELASRLDVNFETSKGILSVADLWKLPLLKVRGVGLCLDDIAKDLHNQIKNNDNVSFVNVARKEDVVLNLKFDIVKHIIDVKVKENIEAAKQREITETRQKLMGIIERKKEEALSSLSIEELSQKLAEMS